MQNRFLFIQTVFLNSALQSFIFFAEDFLPLVIKAYKFMTTSEARFFVSETKKQVMGWDGAVFWGGGHV